MIKKALFVALIITAALGWTKIAGAQESPQLTAPSIDANVQVLNGVATIMWPKQLVLGSDGQIVSITYEVQQRVVGQAGGWQALPHGGYEISIDSTSVPNVATVGSAAHPVGDGYRWRVKAMAAGYTDSAWSATGIANVITPQLALSDASLISAEWEGDPAESNAAFEVEFESSSSRKYLAVVNEGETWDNTSYGDGVCWVGAGDRNRSGTINFPQRTTYGESGAEDQTDGEFSCPPSFFEDDCANGCSGRVYIIEWTSSAQDEPHEHVSAPTLYVEWSLPGKGEVPSPDSAPLEFEFVSQSGTTVNLSWFQLGDSTTYSYDVGIWDRGVIQEIPYEATTATIDSSAQTNTAAVRDVPTGTQYFAVRGKTSGGDGPWTDLVTNLSSPPAPTPMATAYAGEPKRPDEDIYTPGVPLVTRDLQDDDLLLTWGEIEHATAYDVRLNDTILRLESTGLAEQQVIIDLSEHDDLILRYAVRAVATASDRAIEVTNDEDETTYIIPPYITAYSQWSGEGFVQIASGTLSDVSMAEAMVLATPEVNTAAFDIVSTLGQAVGLIEESPAEPEVNAWMLPIALLGSVALSALPIMVIGRGRTDKAGVLAGGMVFVLCWGVLAPTYFGVALPVMIAVLLLIIILGAIALAAKIFL